MQQRYATPVWSTSTFPTANIRPNVSFLRLNPLDATAITGLQSRDMTQYQKIAKITIQGYIEACLKEDGQFREFFKEHCTFTSQIVVNENLDDDPAKRHLQVARYFNSVAERPPQIFIQDGGYSYNVSGLGGGISEGWNLQTETGDHVVRIVDVVDMPITITVATLDEQSCEDLVAFLQAAFGSFQRFTCGYVLRPHEWRNGAYWEVRIPQSINPSAKTAVALHDDPQLRIWSVNFPMDCEFENSSYMKYRHGTKYRVNPGTMSTNAPSTLKLGQRFDFFVQSRPKDLIVYSDDARIAVVEERHTHYVVKARKTGTFNLIVATPHPNGAQGPTVLESTAVTVTAR